MTQTPGTPGAPGTHDLTRHPDLVAVVRLPPGADLPDWATAVTLLSVTATATETSVVCHASSVPAKATAQGPFVPFEVSGPLDFALTGVLAALLVPLADAGISVFTLSTYDTDWVLVREEHADAATEAWGSAGHRVTTPSGAHGQGGPA